MKLVLSRLGLTFKLILKRNIERGENGLTIIKPQLSKDDPYFELYSCSVSFRGKPILSFYYHNRASPKLIELLKEIKRNGEQLTKVTPK